MYQASPVSYQRFTFGGASVKMWGWRLRALGRRNIKRFLCHVSSPPNSFSVYSPFHAPHEKEKGVKWLLWNRPGQSTNPGKPWKMGQWNQQRLGSFGREKGTFGHRRQPFTKTYLLNLLCKVSTLLKDPEMFVYSMHTCSLTHTVSLHLWLPFLFLWDQI